MSFFKFMEDKISGITQKSGDLVSVTKLRMNINRIEGEVSKRKNDLGHLVYKFYIDNNHDSEPIVSICQEIKSLEDSIKEIEIQIEKLQPKEVQCPQCSNLVTSGSSFCAKCGTRVLESFGCKQCGQPLNVGAKFCGTCGSPVSERATEADNAPETELLDQEETLPQTSDSQLAGEKAVIVCSKCGMEMTGSEKFCGGCGNPVNI